MNKYLPFFPGGDESSLFTQKELLEILEFGLPKKWQQKFDEKHYIPTEHDIPRLLMEVEALERSEGDKKGQLEKKRKTFSKDNRKKPPPESSSHRNNKKSRGLTDFYCKVCGHGNHTTKDCWKIHPELKPKKFRKQDEKEEKTTTTTTKNKKTREAMHTTMKADQKQIKRTKKVPKRKIIYESSDTDESVQHMEVQEDADLSKEEKAQRYQAKLAEAEAEDSDEE